MIFKKMSKKVLKAYSITFAIHAWGSTLSMLSHPKELHCDAQALLHPVNDELTQSREIWSLELNPREIPRFLSRSSKLSLDFPEIPGIGRKSCRCSESGPGQTL